MKRYTPRIGATVDKYADHADHADQAPWTSPVWDRGQETSAPTFEPDLTGSLDMPPLGLPWRNELAKRSITYRQRWADRTAVLEASGLPWDKAEQQAWEELSQ